MMIAHLLLLLPLFNYVVKKKEDFCYHGYRASILSDISLHLHTHTCNYFRKDGKDAFETPFYECTVNIANVYLLVSHFICMSKDILDFLFLLFCFMRLYVLAITFQLLKYFIRSRDDDNK
ncbi:hypothetical protein BCV72DRAFT_42941 [Rhizopus microsporus var. microsporus]|uniref:Uncharacterized protein n=1 Tax=Rhizopus microsporus var. microsporus TaxID=86635 RepID=A0A1X0RD73_RHIZD|nr:hypothetical protein BCV72DRAFT_42941 [Rhizopus microsporus var. microsporus]